MGAILHFEIDGTDGFNTMLEQFQENFNNAEPMFEAIGEYQKGIWRDQFAQEGAKTGSQWSALSPGYGAWKARHYPGKPILQLSGDLYDSLAKRPFGVDEITDKQAVFGTAVSYAGFHQKGTDKMPARPLVQKPQSRDRLEFAKYLRNWIVKGSVT